ncbi:MAG: hypothetical protein KGZ61_04710 [Sandarakinorhabdus sp.]|nr:hypothetical protein [Sandarakinorhabdus sp.]
MTLLLETPDGIRTLGPETPESPAIGVIPGDDVALHRLTLLESTPARRLEEARMRAVDLSAQPIDEVHVAVSAADAQGASWIALIDRERMQGHVAHFRAAGIEPASIVPAALLLDNGAPDGTLVRLDEWVVLRTPEVAGAVEPSLAPHVAGNAWTGRFYLLPEFAPEAPDGSVEIDLLQGEFAPRLRWWKQRSFQIPAALLVVLLALLLLAPGLVERTRAAAAVAGYDRAVVEIAEASLGRAPADAEAAAAALAQERRSAEGDAIAARIGHVAAMAETAEGARIDSVELGPDGRLRVTLGGPVPAINRLMPLLLRGPFEAEAQGPQLLLGDRRAGIAATRSSLSAAMLRFVSARSDAALIAAARARPKPAATAATGTQIAAAFAAAGLTDAAITPSDAGTRVVVPAARSAVLLPLLADLELLGARFTALVIARNADDTLNASLEFAP